MIALDTNVLVRFLVEDDADQTKRATELLQQAANEGSPCAAYLIREEAVAAGCVAVATFDEALLAEDGFRAV